jgi:hypothetical protein
MKRLAMLLSLTLANLAHAAVIAVAAEGAVRLELHDTAGPCVGEARHAVFSDGTQRVPGCWVARDGAVHVVFLDGDRASVPVNLFRKPEDV